MGYVTDALKEASLNLKAKVESQALNTFIERNTSRTASMKYFTDDLRHVIGWELARLDHRDKVELSTLYLEEYKAIYPDRLVDAIIESIFCKISVRLIGE